MTMKSLLLLGIATATLVACSPAPQTPDPKPVPEATLTSNQDAEWRAEFKAETDALDRKVHAVVTAVPADYKTRPCVYVARYNSGATYDQAGEYGDGSARDGGAFAYLGTVGDRIKVAGPNYRKDSRYYPLAAAEPDVVALYFDKDSLSRDPAKTDWAANGNETPTGDCKA